MDKQVECQHAIENLAQEFGIIRMVHALRILCDEISEDDDSKIYVHIAHGLRIADEPR